MEIRSTAKCVCLQLRVICSIQCIVYLLISFHCCTKKHTHGSVYTFFSNWCEVSYLCIRCTIIPALPGSSATELCAAAVMLPPGPALQLRLSLNHSSRVSENPYCQVTLLGVCPSGCMFQKMTIKTISFPLSSARELKNPS